MPIEQVERTPEGGNTFGEGMDRAALELSRADVKSDPIRDDAHDAGLFIRNKTRDAKEDLRDFSHQQHEESKGLFGRIGDWFSHKSDEVKDSQVGTTVGHATSGLESKVKEERAKINRNAEEASERHDDSFLTTIGHKVEEAKLYGEEKLHGWKADVRKEQVKNDFGIKREPGESPAPAASNMFGIRTSDDSHKESELDAEVRRLQDMQKSVEKPDPHVLNRLGHRVVEGKQMQPEHIETMLGSGTAATGLPESQSLVKDETVGLTDVTNMTSGIDLNGIHTATRDAVRAQNQAERDMFHGRGDLMTSGPDNGVRFDAAELPKFGERSSANETISDFIHDANQGRSQESQFRYDPRVERLPVNGNVDGLHAFRAEDF